MSKRHKDSSPEKIKVDELTVEQRYAIYKNNLSAFYKENKKKYVKDLYEKLVQAGIFNRDDHFHKDVPWQLIHMKAKAEFDSLAWSFFAI